MFETTTDNLTAQRLYERLGWKRDEEFYRYFLAV
jgi:ribosomal protein S18 acetylase RimI-like enzyme